MEDLEGNAAVPAVPLAAELVLVLVTGIALPEHDRHGPHLVAERERLGDGVLGESGHPGDGDDHHACGWRRV